MSAGRGTLGPSRLQRIVRRRRKLSATPDLSGTVLSLCLIPNSALKSATIQIGHAQGFSLRGIACLINRSPSTISRELRRNRDACGGYSARVAQQQMQARRQVCRPKQKLLPGSERFELVAHMLRERLSPEQIAGKLRSMNMPNLRDAYVCRETIYNAVYALPVGELRKELIACLRQGKGTRRPRAGAVDRRNQIPDMVSIHVRPPEIEHGFGAGALNV